MRGRKRTPTALKILRPTGHPERINRHEPRPHLLPTACPDELTDPTARAEWERAIVPAIEVGIVTSADRTLAVAHCQLWSTWQSQLAEAIRHPHVIAAGPNNYPIPNPARGMANKTLQLLTRVDEALGFSPTSRSRVEVKPPAPTLAAFDKRRAKFFTLERG